ncbi:hypothetical protein [Rhodovulum visakhapatnamense]|uniref:Uncharacterized protein n=1 Tax=Rhodovulum visakhapatnamense TaxID=364297 RepID=A0ABS1RBT8_9RHOB|nr:hypothetical protein [Rhodovulum visakhapatnamense]MBL3568248.1 hypothetical protein [Rhodovulum visakhapatnamense]MBL3576614.1 hypothetical protein [Rhodovulum visakhapatnamense]
MSLRERYQFEREMQSEGSAPKSRAHLHNVVAKYSLDQDLGLEEGSSVDYGLDDTTRDRLVAHARQDAALASVVAAENEKRLVRIERILVLTLIVAIAAFVKG